MTASGRLVTTLDHLAIAVRDRAAELQDPDGYVVRLWDAASMREKGNA